MALFKILRGDSSKLANQEKKDGYAYFTPDTGNFYIDANIAKPGETENLKRIQINAEHSIYDSEELNKTDKIAIKDKYLHLTGTESKGTMSGNIVFEHGKGVWQIQDNIIASSLVGWGDPNTFSSTSSGDNFAPSIGRNKNFQLIPSGNDASKEGLIWISPYKSTVAPFDGSIGLAIGENLLKLDNHYVPHLIHKQGVETSIPKFNDIYGNLIDTNFFITEDNNLKIANGYNSKIIFSDVDQKSNAISIIYTKETRVNPGFQIKNENNSTKTWIELDGTLYLTTIEATNINTSDLSVYNDLNVLGDLSVTKDIKLTSLDSNLIWSEGSYQEKICVDDNGLPFKFQISKNSGSTWESLVDFDDSGAINLQPNTGKIYKKITSQSATISPVIEVLGTDNDFDIFKLHTSDRFGFYLRYLGKGRGDANYLSLYTENKGANKDLLCLSVDQSGRLGIRRNPDTTHNLCVNGRSLFNIIEVDDFATIKTLTVTTQTITDTIIINNDNVDTWSVNITKGGGGLGLKNNGDSHLLGSVIIGEDAKHDDYQLYVKEKSYFNNDVITNDIHINQGKGIIFNFSSNIDFPIITLKDYTNFGIHYKEGSPDVMKFSASGNADTTNGADLCINGAGDGTVTIRGQKILHTGNFDDYALPITGGTIKGSLTVDGGIINFINNGNPYVSMATEGHTFFIQAVHGLYGVGPTWTKTTKWDYEGNVTMPAKLTVNGGVYFNSGLTIIGDSNFDNIIIKPDKSIYFKYNTTNNIAFALLNIYNKANHGIFYQNAHKQGRSYDRMIFSASNSDINILSTDYNTNSADLCINGAGDGTVTIRGQSILHSGNFDDYALPVTGGTLYGNLSITGILEFTNTVNPYIRMSNGSHNYYVQGNDGQIGIGPLWVHATKWDSEGNMSVPSMIKIVTKENETVISLDNTGKIISKHLFVGNNQELDSINDQIVTDGSILSNTLKVKTLIETDDILINKYLNINEKANINQNGQAKLQSLIINNDTIIFENDTRLYVEGNSKFKGNLIPETNNTFLLGDNAHYWKNAYVIDLTVSNMINTKNLTVSNIINTKDLTASNIINTKDLTTSNIINTKDLTASNIIKVNKYLNINEKASINQNGETRVKSLIINNDTIIFENDTKLYVEGNSKFKGNLIPVTENAYNLGNNKQYWNDAYIKNLYISNTINAKDLVISNTISTKDLMASNIINTKDLTASNIINTKDLTASNIINTKDLMVSDIIQIKNKVILNYNDENESLEFIFI